MLVLSRKPGEKVIIGDRITIQVVAVKGNQVRIGIEAPPHVEILREELHDPDLVVSWREGPSRERQW